MSKNTNVEHEEDKNVDKLVEDYRAEYMNLNSALDDLNTCLDSLEEKNDTLFAELENLLQDSRTAREQLEKSQSAQAIKQKNPNIEYNVERNLE
ncbi:uncharacterized protein LOC141908312 [Tubulanus polymorphus]|uniref:uncharacterized protein LOC141908312 n=1 Tax=Tubulanus polymorphus TaxID=672921 RepID=UPI003DA222FA